MSQLEMKLDNIKKTLGLAQSYEYAGEIISFDRATACPRDGQEAQGELSVRMEELAYRLKKDPAFIRDAEDLYAERDKLSELDRCLVEKLHRKYLHQKNIDVERQNRYNLISDKAWVAWSRAKEASDYAAFAPHLTKFIACERERVSLWEMDPEAPLSEDSVYGRLLDDYEPGITVSMLDDLFGEAKERIVSLLTRIESQGKAIRTDFLYRKVTDEQQKEATRYLLELQGFDFNRGTYALSEHPFTDMLGPDNTRVTTHFYEENFLSSVYSVIHECGHALFEMLQPQEDYAYYLNGEKTMGMHESVSRFYENIIGRSRAYIHLIYPQFCRIFPQVFSDVTEEEFYEAVNHVTPSLIRVDADELTYTLHIIIRYELERDLFDGSLTVEDLPRAWNEKYKAYLGMEPENDREGVLQDVHWTHSFGYFPTYALGNFYNAAYYGRMKEELDVDALLRAGDISTINEWMRENVFKEADRKNPAEWILDITGEKLSADHFLTYLEEKYTDLYQLDRLD